MRTVAVIQARLGSTRLPGKVLFDLNGTTVLERVVRRTREAAALDDVVVATSYKQRDDAVERYATAAGAAVSRGSEDDVLGRVVTAAQVHDADAVVRVTSDNPLVSPRVINAVVAAFEHQRPDYAANTVERTFPVGLKVEVVDFERLQAVAERSTVPRHREHVTTALLDEPDRYDLVNVPVKDVFEDAALHGRESCRLTLDTPADYEFLSRVFEGADAAAPISVSTAMAYIDENGIKHPDADA